MKAVTVTCC